MTARVLLAIFDSVYLLALTSWVGSVLFFSFGVAPIIFGVLGEESGGKFVRALMPRYYAWGVISSAIALPALICGPLSVPELRGPIIGAQAAMIGLSLGIMLYGGNVLTPALSVSRDEGPASASKFESLRRRSAWLNVLVLIMGLILLVSFALRRVPISTEVAEKPSREVKESPGWIGRP